jgi:hypothetical protein
MIIFFNFAVYEMWENFVEGAGHRLQYGACWIPKATNTHTGWIMFINFPLEQWFHERASLLRYTYIVSPVFSETCRPALRPIKSSIEWVSGSVPV